MYICAHSDYVSAAPSYSQGVDEETTMTQRNTQYSHVCGLVNQLFCHHCVFGRRHFTISACSKPVVCQITDSSSFFVCCRHCFVLPLYSGFLLQQRR